MKNLKWRLSLTLMLLIASVFFITVPTPAWAAEYDLKPYLGSSIEQAIKTVIPSQFLEHVTTDRLAIDHKGKFRGQVTIQYAQYQVIPGIPGIRKEQRWKIWSGRVVIHWTANYANPKTSDVTVDVANMKGLINTSSVQNTVSKWVKKQGGYLKKYVK